MLQGLNALLMSQSVVETSQISLNSGQLPPRERGSERASELGLEDVKPLNTRRTSALSECLTPKGSNLEVIIDICQVRTYPLA